MLGPEGNPISVGLMALIFHEHNPGLVGQGPVSGKATLVRPALFKTDCGEYLQVKRPSLLEVVDSKVNMLKGILFHGEVKSNHPPHKQKKPRVWDITKCGREAC